jgi:pterin-4a-carbinolamine dehydratase
MSKMQMLYAPERMHLKPERVQQLLRELPGWSLGAGGRAIERSRQFTSVDEAAEFVGLAGQLATSQRQPVTIALAGRNVSLALTSTLARSDPLLLAKSDPGRSVRKAGFGCRDTLLPQTGANRARVTIGPGQDQE